MTGTLYLGSRHVLSKSSLAIDVVNGNNEAEATSINKYTGGGYETEFD